MSDIPMQEFWVGRDVDRLGEHLDRGISKVFFKVSTEDNYGGLLVVDATENDHLPHSIFPSNFLSPAAIYEK